MRFGHYISILLMVSFLLLSKSFHAYANITYRVMDQQTGWKVEGAKNSQNDRQFCTAFNVFEQDFPVHLSKEQGTVALTFFVGNLAIHKNSFYNVKVVFDEQVIVSQDFVTLNKPQVKLLLSSDHLGKLYKADQISLAVNDLGYRFNNSKIIDAKKILNGCLPGKPKYVGQLAKETVIVQGFENDRIGKDTFDYDVAERVPVSDFFASQAPVSAKPAINHNNFDSLVPFDESPLYNTIDQNQGFEPVFVETKLDINPKRDTGQIYVPQNAVQASKSLNTPPILSKPQRQISQPIVQPLDELETAVLLEAPKRESDVEAFDQAFLQERRNRLEKQANRPNFNLSTLSQEYVNKIKLKEDERELFESMKTKMFLLEQEKQAAKLKLRDIRQKEIEALKLDIGSKQKIEQQAQKIRILQEKLNKYQYLQVKERPVLFDEEDASASVVNETPVGGANNVPAEDMGEAPAEVVRKAADETWEATKNGEHIISDIINDLLNDENQ